MVDNLSLETFKVRWDGALRNLMKLRNLLIAWGLDYMTSKGSLQLKPMVVGRGKNLYFYKALVGYG